MNWKTFVSSLLTALVSGAATGFVSAASNGGIVTFKSLALPAAVGAAAGLMNFLRPSPLAVPAPPAPKG